MVLINGRMSPRSFPRWLRFRSTISTLLDCFDLCLAQSDLDAERFAALGSPNVMTSGNLKLDVAAPPADVRKLEVLLAEEVVPAFTRIVGARRLQTEAEEVVEKLFNILYWINLDKEVSLELLEKWKNRTNKK